MKYNAAEYFKVYIRIDRYRCTSDNIGWSRTCDGCTPNKYLRNHLENKLSMQHIIWGSLFAMFLTIII